MTKGHKKLAEHREKMLAGNRKVQPITASAYAEMVGVPALRLGKILKDAGNLPTIPEAFALQAAAKISPKDWIQPA